MSYPRKTWLASIVLAVGCLLISSFSANAGEKAKVLLMKDGELTADDEKDTHAQLKNSPRKVYTVKLTEGKTYKIELKSNAFDAVLRLEDAAGKEVAFNDDADTTNSKSLDSRILYKAEKTENYKVIATLLDGAITGRKNTGKFTLLVAENVEPAKVAKKEAGPTTSIFKGETTELKAIDGKAKVEGELDADTPIVQNHYYRVYTFKMEQGKTYRIDHMSSAFDCFLFLEDPTGKKITQDDDGGEGLNSRIIHKAAKTGDYRLIATSLQGKETGKFTLEIAPASAAELQEIALLERVSDFDKADKDAQKKLTQDVAKHLQGKGAKLSANDVNMATQLTLAVEGTPMATEVFKSVSKILSGAENPQLARLAKSFERIGKEFPVAGKTVDGKNFDLKNMKGKVVLVDFWATWCGPCIAELPNMEAAYKKYHGKGFDIVGISLDRPGDEEKLSKFIENRKMPWPSINIEDSRKLADQYEVNAIPFPVLIDAQGNVVSLRARGPHLDRLLERLLGEKK